MKGNQEMARRRRRTKSRPEALGSLLDRVLEDLGAGEIGRVLRIADHWERAVGPEIASHSRPTQLRAQVLEVSVESSVWSQQLKLRAPEILEALRAELGDDAPSELWFRVG